MTIKLNPFQALIDVIDTILYKNEYTEKPFIRLHVTEISSFPQSGIGAEELKKYLIKLHSSGVINYDGSEIAKELPKVSKIFEPTKNPSVSGASGKLNSRLYNPIVPSARNNFEPKKVLDFSNDFGPIVLKSQGLLPN